MITEKADGAVEGPYENEYEAEEAGRDAVYGPPPEDDAPPPGDADWRPPDEGGEDGGFTPRPPPAAVKLNDEQRAAVEHTGRPLLILAGPGAGKTRTICERIRFIRLKDALCRILAVTFTRKAAGEMRGRIDPGDKRTSIFTFHGFCVRFLRYEHDSAGLGPGFPVWDVNDRLKHVRLAFEDLKYTTRKPSIKAAASRISYWKNLSMRPEDVNEYLTKAEKEAKAFYAGDDPEGPEKAEPGRGAGGADEENDSEETEAAPGGGGPDPGLKKDDRMHSALYRRYETLRKRAGACDYDDLLLDTVKVLEERPDVRRWWSSRLDHVMIDEYQDTNGPQKDIVRLLAGNNPNLCVVGDPDQNIYTWRGAGAANINTFAEEFGAEVVELRRNYRSGSTLVDAARGMIEEAPGATRRRLESALDETGRVDDVYPTDPYDEARMIGEEAVRCAGAGETMGVLYRMNPLSRPIENEFVKRGLRYKVVGGFAFHKRKEVRTGLAILALADNPHDDHAWERLAAEATKGIGKATMARIHAERWKQEDDGTGAAGGGGDGSSAGRLFDLDEEHDPDGPRAETMRAAAWAVAARGKRVPGPAKSAVRGLEHGIRRLASLGRQDVGIRSKLAQALRTDLSPTGDYRRWLVKNEKDPHERTANLDALCDAAREYEQTADEPSVRGFIDSVVVDSKEAGDEEEAGLMLMTMHASKGLEYDVVFIAHCAEGITPHSRSATEEARKEERRVFYVAATRAKKRLILSTPSVDIAGKPLAVSRFVESFMEHAEEAAQRNAGGS